MSFHKDRDHIFEEGIKPGVESANSGIEGVKVQAYRVDQDPINTGVSDYLPSQIRRAQFRLPISRDSGQASITKQGSLEELAERL
jgi:hypothetical protein